MVLLCQDAAKKRPAAAPAGTVDLPEGWQILTKKRATGASSGAVDKYYKSPTGKLFRSLAAVQKELGNL